MIQPLKTTNFIKNGKLTAPSQTMLMRGTHSNHGNHSTRQRRRTGGVRPKKQRSSLRLRRRNELSQKPSKLSYTIKKAFNHVFTNTKSNLKDVKFHHLLCLLLIIALFSFVISNHIKIKKMERIFTRIS